MEEAGHKLQLLWPVRKLTMIISIYIFLCSLLECNDFFLHNKLLFKISIIKVLEVFLPLPLGWITIGKGKEKGKGKGKKREQGRGREEREERSRVGRKKGRKERKYNQDTRLKCRNF